MFLVHAPSVFCLRYGQILGLRGFALIGPSRSFSLIVLRRSGNELRLAGMSVCFYTICHKPPANLEKERPNISLLHFSDVLLLRRTIFPGRYFLALHFFTALIWGSGILIGKSDGHECLRIGVFLFLFHGQAGSAARFSCRCGALSQLGPEAQLVPILTEARSPPAFISRRNIPIFTN